MAVKELKYVTQISTYFLQCNISGSYGTRIRESSGSKLRKQLLFLFFCKNPNGKHLKAFGLMKDCMPKYSIVWTADNYRGAIRRPQ